jgi:hypothetical protein
MTRVQRYLRGENKEKEIKMHADGISTFVYLACACTLADQSKRPVSSLLSRNRAPAL